MRLTLPKSRRLLNGSDFAKVRVDGRRFAQGCVVINWLPTESGRPWRLGIITTKALGSAVVRNRARRRIREAFRRQQAVIVRPADIVLIARASVRDAGFDRVCNDLATALRKAGLTGPA